MFLDVKCQSSPCWGPTPPPMGAWLIYSAIAVIAGLIILADWKLSPAGGRSQMRTAVLAWLAAVALIAVSAEALELYRYSITPK